MKLSEKIVFLRKQQGMSQEQLSYKLNVSRQAIYRWETEASTPDLDNLKALSEIFNIPYNDLLNDSIDLSSTPNVQINNSNNTAVIKNRKPLLYIFISLLSVLTITVIVLSSILIANSVEHEHDLGQYQIVKLPTCKEAGLESRKCSTCNYSETRQIACIPHSEISVQGRAPTCKNTGLTEGKKCSVCKVILVEQTTIPLDKNAHSSTRIEATQPTCVNTGLTEGLYCSLCNITLTEQKPVYINSNNHTAVIVPAVEATCISTGLTEGLKCKDCNHIIKEQAVIPITNHTPVTIKGKSPSCTMDGRTDGVSCSICKTTIVAQQTIQRLDHVVKITSGYAPTCEKPGVTDSEICTECFFTIKLGERIDPLGHTPKTIIGTSATCCKSGLTDGSYCSVCNKTLVEQTKIYATARHFDNYETIPNTHAIATCLTPETVMIKCTGDESCTQTKQQILSPALEHIWELDTERMVNGTPICSTHGHWPYICKRSVNGEVCGALGSNINGETQTTYLHTFVPGDFSTAPTCTSRGTYDCTTCGENFTGYLFDEASDPTESHSFTIKSEDVESTCISQGYTIYKCSADPLCTATHNDDYTPVYEFHRFDSSSPLKTLICPDCNATFKRHSINTNVDDSLDNEFCLCGKCEEGNITCGGSITGTGTQFGLTNDSTTSFDLSSQNIGNGFILLSNDEISFTLYDSNDNEITTELKIIDNYVPLFDCPDVARVEAIGSKYFEQNYIIFYYPV